MYDLRWKFINGANRDNRLTFPRYRASKIILIVVSASVFHVMLMFLSITTPDYFIVARKSRGKDKTTESSRVLFATRNKKKKKKKKLEIAFRGDKDKTNTITRMYSSTFSLILQVFIWWEPLRRTLCLIFTALEPGREDFKWSMPLFRSTISTSNLITIVIEIGKLIEINYYIY